LRARQRRRHGIGTALGRLLELYSDLALERRASAGEGDQREDASGHRDEGEGEEQQLGAQRQVGPRPSGGCGWIGRIRWHTRPAAGSVALIIYHYHAPPGGAGQPGPVSWACSETAHIVARRDRVHTS
jgi:hypothetical protein